MVTVTFRLTDAKPVRFGIDRPEPLSDILAKCRAELDEEFGSVIVLRKGRIVTPKELIYPEDTLDIFPAISGG